VNHFKSKSCGDATGADLDQGDGQSCFNARRTAQATALASVLDTLDAPNPLVIGDLNSYSNEDPIDTLEDAGFTGLTELYVPDANRYSFVFDGNAGELDHAMAGADLLDNVTGATIWHINADEPAILDYNTEFNPPTLYQPDAYRSSDHDPLLVGLQLAEVPGAPAVSVLAGWGAATVSWQAPDDGGSPITGYRVRALVNGQEVASASVGPSTLTYTFGGLANGVPHTFEVVATNAIGTSPPGSATATPFVPNRYTRLDAATDCPGFTASNPNAFPVSVTWTTSRGETGADVVPAGETIALEATAPAGRTTTLRLFADNKFQDAAKAKC
jgi:hypothetical protein